MFKKVMVLVAAVIAFNTVSFGASDVMSNNNSVVLQTMTQENKVAQKVQELPKLPSLVSQEEMAAFVNGGKVLMELGNGIKKIVVGGVELYALCTTGVGSPIAIFTNIKDGFYEVVSAVKQVPDAFTKVVSAVKSIGGKVKGFFDGIKNWF